MTEDQRMAAIKGALKSLKDEFLKDPTLFFTEHDIASRCYALIQESLNHETVELKGRKKTYLVHHEYPTPFRCDMEKHNFHIEDEDSKFQRGHYDLVVFNPNFLKDLNYELAKGQDYAKLKAELPNYLKEHAILLGIEFMLNRKPFTSKTDADNWCKSVMQDYNKLNASLKWIDQKSVEHPFMKEYIMLAFDASKDKEHRDYIRGELSKNPQLEYCAI